VRVLIAEDDATSSLMLQHTLERLGYEVLAFAEGAGAWQALCGEAPPQLVLLDWSMPQMDGLEVCRRLRARRGANYTYTILLTSRAERDDVVTGLEAGADDFVTKPFDPEELRARLRTGERILSLEAALTRSRAHMAEVLANIDSGVLLSDPGGRVLLSNAGLALVTGDARARIEGMARRDFMAQQAERLSDPGAFLQAMDAPAGEVQADFQKAHRRQVVRWASKPVPFAEGQGRLDICRDVTAEIELARVLSEQALTDPLTRLVNRRGGEQGIARELSRQARGQSQPLSLALLDIDHFKRVNDVHGHAVGDKVLTAVAAIILGAVRQADLAIRWGGEEVLLVLPNTTGDAAREVVNRLRLQVEASRLEGVPPVTFSAGVAQWTPSEPITDTIARADARLYEAKAQGRNRVL
jgi:two-component system cell cycle response regulator